jgi:hypothetical protein
MNAPVKVAGFLVGLAVVFGAATGIGSLFDPVAEPAAAHDSGDGAHETGDDAGHGDTDDQAGQTHATTDDSAEEIPGGLMVSQAGYTFRLDDPSVRAGRDVPVTFTIEGPGGPVTTYDVEHEKRLHLIAVRRDFSGFQHVHPELAADGTWSTRLDLSAGQWRLYADFKPTGADALTLGTDLAVAGEYRPAAPPAESRTAVVDGYTVTLTGDLTPGADSELVLRVSRDGEPVTDLEPYLGAYGHLVALRAGDLAYLHVHPDGTPGDGSTEPGPDVTFFAAVPSAGTYHLYLDFKHQGVVRTASFTLGTGAGTDAPEATHDDSGDDHGH